MSLKKLSGNQQLFHLICCSMVSSSSPGSEACKENPATRTLWNRLQHPHHQTMPLPAFPGVGSPSPAGNILSLKERGLMFLGKPSESQGKHTWEVLLRRAPRGSRQNFSHTCLHPPFPLPANSENPTFQNIILPFLLQLPCRSAAGSLSSTQKHSMVWTTSSGEGKRGEMITAAQRHGWDVQFCAHLRGACFPAAARQHLFLHL